VTINEQPIDEKYPSDFMAATLADILFGLTDSDVDHHAAIRAAAERPDQIDRLAGTLGDLLAIFIRAMEVTVVLYADAFMTYNRQGEQRGGLLGAFNLLQAYDVITRADEWWLGTVSVDVYGRTPTVEHLRGTVDSLLAEVDTAARAAARRYTAWLRQQDEPDHDPAERRNLARAYRRSYLTDYARAYARRLYAIRLDDDTRDSPAPRPGHYNTVAAAVYDVDQLDADPMRAAMARVLSVDPDPSRHDRAHALSQPLPAEATPTPPASADDYARDAPTPRGSRPPHPLPAAPAAGYSDRAAPKPSAGPRRAAHCVPRATRHRARPHHQAAPDRPATAAIASRPPTSSRPGRRRSTHEPIPGQLMLPLRWPDPQPPPSKDRHRWRLLWSPTHGAWLLYPPGVDLTSDSYHLIDVELRRQLHASRLAAHHIEGPTLDRRTEVIRWQPRQADEQYVAVTRPVATHRPVWLDQPATAATA